MDGVAKNIICALDTSDVNQAIQTIKGLSGHVSAFKIGHALTLAYGLDVIPKLQDAGAHRIFLDLKFHDIPNSVAIAVREAAKRSVWMLTIHTTGGPAMMSAAIEATQLVEEAPLIVGVSVLTSLEQNDLTHHLGVQRSIEDQMVYLAKLAMNCELDGVVCSPHEVVAVRKAIGSSGIIVTPGIRPSGGSTHDQARVGSAIQAQIDGADYLVVGRALTEAATPMEGLASLGLV